MPSFCAWKAGYTAAIPRCQMLSLPGIDPVAMICIDLPWWTRSVRGEGHSGALWQSL